MSSSKNNTGIYLDPNLIRDARMSLGLSQEALAEQAKITRRTIQRAENGDRIGLRTAKQIANALGVEISKLQHQRPEAVDLDSSIQQTEIPIDQLEDPSIDQSPYMHTQSNTMNIKQYLPIAFILVYLIIDHFYANAVYNAAVELKMPIAERSYQEVKNERDATNYELGSSRARPFLPPFNSEKFETCLRTEIKRMPGQMIVTALFARESMNNIVRISSENCVSEQT